MEIQKFAVLGAHRNTIPAVWYDRCVTKCAVVKGLMIFLLSQVCLLLTNKQKEPSIEWNFVHRDGVDSIARKRMAGSRLDRFGASRTSARKQNWDLAQKIRELMLNFIFYYLLPKYLNIKYYASLPKNSPFSVHIVTQTLPYGTIGA